MHIRPAVPSDFPQCATISCAAWLDSPVNEYLLPRRHSHPAAYHKYYLRSLKRIPKDKRAFPVVVEIGEEEGDKEIVGYATWVRNGDSEETKKKWGEESEKKPFLKRMAATIWDSSVVEYAYTLFNPAASLPRDLSYGKADEVYYSENDAEPEECWMLTYLSVSPDHQRKGVGMELCQWGMERAREEGICAFLYSTVAGRRLYEKAGFRAVGDWRWAKGGDDRVMTIMKWNLPSTSDIKADVESGINNGEG